MKQRIEKFRETGDSRYIYQNELQKGCFQHDMAYGDFKDLPRRTASDKVLLNKTFNIAKYSKYDGYQRGPGSTFTNILIKSPHHLQINLLLAEQLKMKLRLMNNYVKNYTKITLRH